MSFAENLYSHLPATLQNTAISLAGYRLNHFRYGGDYKNILAKTLSRQNMSPEAIAAFRDLRLHAFITHAYQNTEFYKLLFDRLGAHPSDFKTLESLKTLPVLTKQTAKDHLEGIRVRLGMEHTIMCHTSGTTGSGLIFPSTRKALQEQWAVWWRYRHWHGLFRGKWCAYFGGRSVVPTHRPEPPFWRVNQAEHQIMFSAFHMSQHNLLLYMDEICRRRIEWVHGYPSAISLLAQTVIDSGRKFRHVIRYVTCGAENLTEQQRTVIATAFGTTPLQHYGLSEATANASECPLGSLHLDEDFAAMEFIDTPEGTRLIGTNLSNPAFPLIRYDSGDYATVGGPCACGRPGRIIERLDGRQEDYLVLSNGAKVGRLDHVFKDLVEVREAQFVQSQPGKAVLKVVKGSAFNANSERELKNQLYARLADYCHVDILYTNELPRTSRGKLRFVIHEKTQR